MKILVVQTAYIGDVILATSLAQTLADLSETHQIDFLVRNGNEGLLQNNPFISNILVWNKKRKLRSLLSNLFKIRGEKYDAVINIQRFANSGILTALSGARRRIGFDKNPMSFFFTDKIEHKIPHQVSGGEYLHEVQRNAALLEPIFPDMDRKEAKRPCLYFNQSIEQKIEEIIYPLGGRPYVVLAPTSVWFTKQWSAQKWSELSKELSEKFELFFIGAPADATSIDGIIDGANNCHNLAGKLSLLESACLMRSASRVIVNDSAPLHLASSVNAKTTAIFCSTVPEFGYGPLSDDSVIITRAPRLSCQPCGLHGRPECPLEHFKCSLEIPVSDVSRSISPSNHSNQRNKD